MNQLIDKFGRVHNYLRISVTDRCNLRCKYCMTEDGVDFINHENILKYEEMINIIKAGVDLGINKIRITGGEPLVRKGIESFIADLNKINEINDISMTTNGVLLAAKAEKLKEAGLKRVNISLDTLKSDKYEEITRNGNIQNVLNGIKEAIKVGLKPIKINTVLIKGFNDDEIEELIKLTIKDEIQLRFIEYMPIGHANHNWKNGYLSLEYIKNHLQELGYDFEDDNEIQGNGPSDYIKIKGAKGSIGFIHAISHEFCSTCNRLRLTADGFLKPCLYWDEEINMKPFVNDKEKLKEIFVDTVNNKLEKHEMLKNLTKEEQSEEPTHRKMSQIGG